MRSAEGLARPVAARWGVRATLRRPRAERATRTLRASILGLLLLAGAAAAAAAAGPAAAPASPGLFHSAAGAFRAAFPAEPRFEDERKTTLLGPLRTRSWEVERGSLRLRVERHDLPRLAPLLLGARGLLERAKRGIVEDLAARDVQQEPLERNGRPGLRLRYRPGDHPEEREEARLFLLGRRLYVLFARGAAGEEEEVAQRFLDSVEIEDPELPAAGGAASSPPARPRESR